MTVQSPLLEALFTLRDLPPLCQLKAKRVWRSSTPSSVVICELNEKSTEGVLGLPRVVLAAAPPVPEGLAVALPGKTAKTSQPVTEPQKKTAAEDNQVPHQVPKTGSAPWTLSSYRIPRVPKKVNVTKPSPQPSPIAESTVKTGKRQATPPRRLDQPSKRPRKPLVLKPGAKCFNCRKEGHHYSECTVPVTEPFCMACGAMPYTIKTCPLHSQSWRARGEYHRYYDKNIPHADYVRGNF